MQEPCEQDVELLMLVTGSTRAEALRSMARAAAEWELLRQRAVAGDREAIEQFRADQRELARMFAQAQASNEVKLAELHSLTKEGAPA